MQNEKQKETEYTPDDLVRYYKYYKRLINDNVKIKQSFNNISTKTCYKKHQKVFDKLHLILTKYKINHIRYIKFCVMRLYRNRWSEDDPKFDLLQPENFIKYAAYTKEREQYFKIYKMYMKNVNYVADKCIQMKITPVDYIKYLIVNNKMAYEYFCGNISKYFLASIYNFKEIYEKLDNLNKEELKTVYNICEELNKDVQNAFLMIKSHQVTPIMLITKTIEKKLTENNK